MQMVSEVMTRNVQFVSPQESLQRAAEMMDELNVGALPVCDGEHLVGMVTDRDITVRATAAGKAPGDAHVEEVMSTDVRWCFEDQSIDEVMQKMADTQIRRVPVVSHDDAHRLIGIVSLGDVATKASAQGQGVEKVVGEVSSPSEPDRSSRGTERQQASGATGSDTGTATGFAGSDAMGAAGATGAAGSTRAQGAAGIGTAGGTDRAASARADTAGNTENTGETGAPGGTDAAGATGASGGTAGTAGSAGSGAGARP